MGFHVAALTENMKYEIFLEPLVYKGKPNMWNYVWASILMVPAYVASVPSLRMV